MKESKQQRHITTNNAGCDNKPIEFYKRKLQSIKSQKGIMTAFTGVNIFTVCYSYVALHRKNNIIRSAKSC